MTSGVTIAFGIMAVAVFLMVAVRVVRSAVARTRPILVDGVRPTRPTPADVGWLDDERSNRPRLPKDVHDVQGWNRYWTAELAQGGMEQGFGDMLASDPEFIPTLTRRRARSVLCVGNGLSTEAMALALHGFEVTALDLSTVPQAAFAAMLADTNHPLRRVPGLTVGPAGDVTFAGTDPIDPVFCPRMHETDSHRPSGGGSLAYVTGDLLDVNVCGGPFDVVIERRTVQLFSLEERSIALERLAARLAPQGLLVSHQHMGWWKPGQPRDHYASEWTRANGFISPQAEEPTPPARVASLVFTTG